ncbi:hypothetical protein ACIQOF_21945 [Streptomyces sp. NPDC091265]|uniref:hypothetical protein n=1 Tax=unclassified Streptomyces TaxID=2593676 RepID=UPI00344F2B54
MTGRFFGQYYDPETGAPGASEFTGSLDKPVQLDGHDVGNHVIQRPHGAYQLSTCWLNS